MIIKNTKMVALVLVQSCGNGLYATTCLACKSACLPDLHGNYFGIANVWKYSLPAAMRNPRQDTLWECCHAASPGKDLFWQPL